MTGFFRILLLPVLLMLLAAPAMALTAREIMEKVDARNDGDNGTSVIEMTLFDRNNNQRQRQIRSFTRDQGRDTRRMMFFLSPEDVRGTGFLTYDYYAGNRDDDQWLYLPELRKTKRIASSDKSGSFMGSDFSYADMTRRVLSEWTFTLLKEDEVRGKKVWVIETVPANRTIRNRYGYEKSVIYVRQDIFMVVRAVHWVRDGGKLKYFDIKKLKKVSGIWVGTEMEMKTTKNRQTTHRTVMRFSGVKFGQNLGEDMFSLRRLEQGE